MKESIKILIVDDEHSSRESLQKIIREFFTEFIVIGTAKNVQESIILYNEHKPKIILLDIEMPLQSGFDLIDLLKDSECKYIFITAYSSYAIKAFKYSAVDYLLKPVDINELKAALSNAKSLIEKNIYNSTFLKEVIEGIKSNTKTKLAINAQKETVLVDIDNIIRMNSDGNYTRVFLSDNTSVLATRILKDFDEILEEEYFIRVHNSHIINLNYLEKYLRKDGHFALLKDGSKIPISVRRKELFENALYKFSRC
jgi:two-component system LytT family response regulator